MGVFECAEENAQPQMQGLRIRNFAINERIGISVG